MRTLSILLYVTKEGIDIPPSDVIVIEAAFQFRFMIAGNLRE